MCNLEDISFQFTNKIQYTFVILLSKCINEIPVEAMDYLLPLLPDYTAQCLAYYRNDHIWAISLLISN